MHLHAKTPEKNSCTNALSFWCQLDTDIVFLNILTGYWLLLFQTSENRILAPNAQLPITFVNNQVLKLLK